MNHIMRKSTLCVHENGERGDSVVKPPSLDQESLCS